MGRFLKKQLPAALLAVLMMVSLLPVAGAAGADITKTVEAGDEIVFNRREFRSLFTAEESGTFYYLEFEDFSDLDDFGCFYAYNYSGKHMKLTESTLENAYFYYEDDDVPKAYDYALNGLVFEAASDARGTLSLTFTLHSTQGEEVAGTMDIRVPGSSGSSSDALEIVYSLEPGESVSFRGRDFRSIFTTVFGSSDIFWRMEFLSADNLSDFGTLSVYDYAARKDVALKDSDVSKYWFYYNSDDNNDYLIEDLSFEAADDANGETVTLDLRLYGEDDAEIDAVLYIDIGDADSSSGSDTTSSDILYEMDAGAELHIDRTDFRDLFNVLTKGKDSFYYMIVTDSKNVDEAGHFYALDYSDGSVELDAAALEESQFYYFPNDYSSADTDCYALGDLSFVSSGKADGKTVTLDCTLFGEDGMKSNIVVTIQVGDEAGKNGAENNTLPYKCAPSKSVDFIADDFATLFKATYKNYDLNYVVFTASENLNSYNGYVYYQYGGSKQQRFPSSTLESSRFYYDEDDIPAYEDDVYPLDGLSFVASSYFDTPVTLKFRAHYNDKRYVEGVLTVSPSGVSTFGTLEGDIIYQAAYNAKVQINAYDIARFFSKACPGSTFQYARFGSVPAKGTLYYDYYGANKTAISGSSVAQIPFYLSPGTNQLSLSELTYVPYSSNYCVTLPFTAYGSSGKSASGTILISISLKTVSEVYGATPKNTAVTFPASAIVAAVSGSTGTIPHSIQLLQLPDASVGTVYVGSGTSLKAKVSELYGNTEGTYRMSQLRFVPASGFSGSVEIPYAACNSSGTPIAVGKFCLGVVSNSRKFTDVTTSTWCYKYVVELADTGVIGGYPDNTYRPDSTINYGAALKLIMLAAGYPEQAPTDSNVFSGYLAKARAEGIVTRTNVDLTSSITRLQVAQLAAGALKLNTTDLSSVKPFTDTSDASVQALNAAGIVGGYFENGVSTYRPNNTLTRGHVAAIVWRMQNYRK